MTQSSRRITPLSISDQANYESNKTTKPRGYIRSFVLRDKITIDTYEDSNVLDCRLFERKLFHIKNKGANSIHFKILACIDPIFGWEELLAETALAASASTYEWDSEPWAYVKIQVKSAAAGNAGKIDALITLQH